MENPETQPQTAPPERLTDRHALKRAVREVVKTTPVLDMHTHLFAPQFGALNLWGVDELVTYHYLIAEVFRFDASLTPDQFWGMTKTQQADRIWDTLFVRSTPLSEATRGVVRVLATLGLDPAAPNLNEARAFFREQNAEDYITRVLDMAGVSDVVMTNDPFDPAEAPVWESDQPIDPRFHAVLRMDPLLNDWPNAAARLTAQGFDAHADLDIASAASARRFLTGWIERMKPLYLAVSLPDDVLYPDDSPRGRLIRDVVLPACREHDLPFAMMIGVRRAVNPALRLAGDGLGKSDIRVVERICAENSDNRFLVTMLSREDQHELVVAARKFANLLPFGCWWFLNNPSIIKEITVERLEMLGASFVPQHSDARVVDQLLYKWPHSRRVIGKVLTQTYGQLLDDGRAVTREEIQRDVQKMFAGNFRGFTRL